MQEFNYDSLIVDDVNLYIDYVKKGYVSIELIDSNPNELFHRLLELEQSNDKIACALAKAYLFGVGTTADERRGYSMLTSLVKTNNPDVFYHLAYCYYNEKGIKKDYEQAVYWVKKACAYHHPKALCLFGKMAMYGHGIPASIKEAIKLFNDALNNGSVEAYDILGCIYLNGTGVKASVKTAIEYLQPAAESGYAPSEYNLARAYQKGIDGTPDYVNAITWYRKAGKSGFARAYMAIGLIYFNGESDSVSKEEAFICMERAASMNLVQAQFKLARVYESEKRFMDAAKWYKTASELGMVDATISLAQMYANGRGIKPNYVEAIKYYQIAANQGNAKAYAAMGNLYARGGNGIDKNFYKGIECIEKAIEINYSNGYYEIGLLYSTDGQFQDYEKALYYFDQAKSFDIPEAYLMEARLFKSDKFFDYDPEQCISNYEKAIELGNAVARKEKDEFIEYLKSMKVCIHCGGEFKGILTKVCEKCGKQKDY